MRSRPYTPPPPLPPLLTELSAYLPNSSRGRDTNSSKYHQCHHGNHGSAVALADLDPETSRLLPRKRQPQPQHRVRVQGKLAPVRSVSVVNLVRGGAGPGDHHHHRRRAHSPRGDAEMDAAVGATLTRPRTRGRRRKSLDDVDVDVDVDGDEGGDMNGDGGYEAGEDEVGDRDTQLRGYGIGGRGNIRRPTDVIGTSSSRTTSLSLSSLFSSSGPVSPGPGSGSGPDKRFTLAGLLNRMEDRRVERKGYQS
ncbi:uncharacterized protein GGS25DRAFT_70489 [Hypoxylon fragiforme]|uniref:uncharacterized protein n=1 Tax=Hypoxylon fragiforme TaxID=63214 RepID=UPI0020C678C7|nr:uncharacterized protein GGS25DRAFT_70489 [Hypoxylon fragiforme]KAI2602886.1 hypothetical protein GGS25DRAFT_70489 [Hypoxylon fragiforme]